MTTTDQDTVKTFAEAMGALKLRPITISKRLDIIRRLSFFLGDTNLLAADLDQLREFQKTFANLSPASVNVYTRHVRAFYLWAFDTERIPANTAARLRVPRVPKAVPHPTSMADLRVVLKCAPNHLRTTYILASFAGLRCGEIARLRTEHLDLNTPTPTALIDGKGGKQRIVPLLSPVANELRYRARGWVVTQTNGGNWSPESLSAQSTAFLHSIGVPTTLHSMRHFFATMAVRLTKDTLLVRDLLGHASVQTTEGYMQMDPTSAFSQLDGLNSIFSDLLGAA